MDVKYIAVIGGGECEEKEARLAEEVGGEIAKAGAVLICGGLGGVMEAACRGAKKEGGTTVGILPGHDRATANEYVDIPIATGMSYTRNFILASASDALIAVGGKYGTLSELSMGLNLGKRVIGLRTWDIPGVLSLSTAEEAVRQALRRES